MMSRQISAAVRLRMFMDRVEIVTESGCWIWTGGATRTDSRSELRPRMLINRKRIWAYRFAYEQFIGPIPAGLNICHRCDVALCVNPAHLFAGTQRQNLEDMFSKGRARRAIGGDAPNVKLTIKDVLAIRRDFRPGRGSGANTVDLARKYGVHNVSIAEIVKGKSWAHLKAGNGE